MATLIDENWGTYTVGANPPFGNLKLNGVNQPAVVASPTIFGDTRALASPPVRNLIWPTQTPDKTLTSYTAFTAHMGLNLLSHSTQNGVLMEFYCFADPFDGILAGGVQLEADGSISMTMPGVSKNSDFSVLCNAWYWLRCDITFANMGGFIGCTFDIQVNGLSVLSGTLISTTLFTAYTVVGNGPVTPFVNTIMFGGAGGGMTLARLTVYDTIQSANTFPHVGSPVAQVDQGVIELLLTHPPQWRTFEA